MTYSNEDSLICSKCGTSNSEGSLFCSNCGATLTKEEVSTKNNHNEYSSSDFSDDELSLFLEKNQGYYMEKFKTMNKTADKKSWNWCAFLFGGYWIFYRKMYVEGIIYIISNTILACIPFIGWILNIAIYVCAGLFGNSFYYEHIKKKFVEISCADSSMRTVLIQKNGGTNIILPIILLAVPIVIVLILTIFISTLGIVSTYSYY